MEKKQCRQFHCDGTSFLGKKERRVTTRSFVETLSRGGPTLEIGVRRSVTQSHARTLPPPIRMKKNPFIFLSPCTPAAWRDDVAGIFRRRTMKTVITNNNNNNNNHVQVFTGPDALSTGQNNNNNNMITAQHVMITHPRLEI